ncbi:hypothetical protein PC112_g8789 [Phytophthora cactorum]|nr:hypothetical protein PC112_g8789 [Phytophthora cactorum]
MRRRLEKPVASDHLPDVAGPSALDERVSNGPAPPRGVTWGPTTASPAPKYLFTSPVAPARSLDTMRSLDLRDKKKLRCIWLAPDEGDQQIVRPPPLDSMQYAQISASMFGNNVMEKIKRADSLSVQLERSNRFMDAMHTYEQAAKMLLRCIQKREEASGVIMDELKWLRIDYEIRCVQLVALCMCGARKTATGGDNTAFLLLKKAEELTARDGLQYCKKHVQRAAVYQNVANYYKKQKKYQAALQAAEKAVRINDKLPPSDRFPIAYFLQACLHGLLQEPAKAGFMYTACLAVAESQRPANETPQTAEVFYTLKAATLHNLAIEWANLNMPDQTRDALASAMEVGVHYLAQTHPVVVRILETYKYNSHKERILEEARSFGVRRRAATKIQKLWERALLRLQVVKRKENAAILIQSILRMHHQKAQYDQTLRIVRRTQAVWRGGLTRTRKKMALASVVQIQSAWRCRNERAKYAIRKIRLVLLQSVVRGFLARTARTRKNKAAAGIQAQMRRHLCMKEFIKTLAAAAIINRVLRGMQARQRVENGVKCVVSGALKDLVEAVEADDMEVQVTKATVESTFKGLVAIVSIEPERDEQLEKSSDDLTPDVEGILDDKYQKVLNVVSVGSPNDREENTESFQIVGDGVKSAEDQDYEEDTPPIETPPTVECTTKFQTFPLLNSDSDRAILEAMMSSTISKFIDASIIAAINDCSNDIHFAVDLGSNSPSGEEEAIVEMVSTTDTTLEVLDTPVAVEDAVGTFASSEQGAVEAKHEDNTLVQDPVVEAAGTGMAAAEVSLERAASNINCSPSIPEAVAKVSIVPDTTTKPTTIPEIHLEAGPSTAKPAVDAEVSEVMAAVLSQVSIAPAKPVEVEPVVETAASERGESVAVDAVEVAAAVEAAISAAESTPAATETPGLQEMLTEAAMPAETVEEVAAAPAKEEPAVDAEVSEVMAAVLSQVSIAPAKPVEVEPVVETAASERGESVAVDAVEVAAAVEAAISAAESTPAATETPGLQEMLTEAAMPAETVEEVAAAPAKEEPAVDAEVSEVMAAVLSQVSIAPAKPVEVEPVVETAASERGESVAVDAVEVAAKMACLT